MTNEKKGIASALEDAKKELESIDKEVKPKTYTRQENVVNALEIAHNQSIRAKKAEAKAKTEEKTSKNEEEKTSKNDFSPKDYLALSQAGVPADDLDEVTDFAKYKGITISEALKTSYVQNTLKEKSEERATANATNTKGGRHGTSEVSGKALLKEFSKSGTIPDSDKDLDAMLEADFKAKLNK